jgi:cation transport regulator
MPYASNEDLPAAIRRALPQHAQDIYRAAFNGAWGQYEGGEAAAHRIAWAAVKKRYEKVGGIWRPKQECS